VVIPIQEFDREVTSGQCKKSILTTEYVYTGADQGQSDKLAAPKGFSPEPMGEDGHHHVTYGHTGESNRKGDLLYSLDVEQSANQVGRQRRQHEGVEHHRNTG